MDLVDIDFHVTVDIALYETDSFYQSRDSLYVNELLDVTQLTIRPGGELFQSAVTSDGFKCVETLILLYRSSTITVIKTVPLTALTAISNICLKITVIGMKCFCGELIAHSIIS